MCAKPWLQRRSSKSVYDSIISEPKLQDLYHRKDFWKNIESQILISLIQFKLTWLFLLLLSDFIFYLHCFLKFSYNTRIKSNEFNVVRNSSEIIDRCAQTFIGNTKVLYISDGCCTEFYIYDFKLYIFWVINDSIFNLMMLVESDILLINRVSCN